MSETMPPPPQRGQGLNFKERAESYHRSSNAPHGSKVSARVQPDELLQNFVRTQRDQVAAQSRSASAAVPNQRTDSSRTSHPSTADVPSSTRMATPHPGSDRIRVSCTLGSSAISFWLDLDASAQEFFVTLYKELEKKKNTLNRATTSVLFTCDKTSDAEGREIQLSEDELEADWEETMEWIRDNKRQKSPHIYAALQCDEG
jgi:activator of HSP90 ATPase